MVAEASEAAPGVAAPWTLQAMARLLTVPGTVKRTAARDAASLQAVELPALFTVPGTVKAL